MPEGQQRSTFLRGGGNTAKVIVRDISESLGKLPPQYLDLEEAVLGAVMLEKTSIDEVIDFLHADHFYVEAHKEIYAACRALRINNEPTDMRSVVAFLKKAGKIELVGGAYYIAELTSKVSSSASIQYHSRLIVEASAKREMIQIASAIHMDAYEDGTDVFKFLEKQLQIITDLNNRLKGKSAGNIKELWAKYQITTRPPEEIPLIKINGCTVATQSNHSLLVGKKKTRKTLFIIWLICEAIRMKAVKPDEILIFDTEQGKHHVWRMFDKLKTLTGHSIAIYHLRGQTPQERKDFIDNTIRFREVKPKLVAIDGIRDLMQDINDPIESTNLISWLEKLTLENDLHVINVIHLNKTDNNARGHIGTELLNKAQVTIELELEPKTQVTLVKCESSRDKPFDTFAFTHGMDDLPEVVDVPSTTDKKLQIPEDQKKVRLKAIFGENLITYKEFTDGVRQEFSVGVNRAGSMIAEFVRFGWVAQSGKRGTKDARYKLMLGGEMPAEPMSIMVVDKIPEPDLFSQPQEPVVDDPDAPFDLF
jgi:hypothetical protein